MPDAEQLRQAAGETAMVMMDRVDEDLVAALDEYVPHLREMASRVAHWETNYRINLLAGMAVQAALEAGD